MISAEEGLERLREGNRRFVAGEYSTAALTERSRPGDLAAAQSPFAIIVGCSDSRVPAELVFDQGLGDLFVIRVAGNIVAPSQIGSVEFAAEQFGTRLVLVLGHSSCGAVMATLDDMERPAGEHSPGIRSIVDRIRPSLERLPDRGLAGESAERVQRAVRANIEASVDQLRHGSEILERRIQSGELVIDGAEYCLETGHVEFLEHAPSAGS